MCINSTSPRTSDLISHNWTFCMRRHSKASFFSQLRGGLTNADGTAVRPATANSSTSGPNSIADRFICSRLSSLTRLTTNSPDRENLRPVSVGSACDRCRMEKPTTAGSSPKALKNENGAALVRPASSSVETHAIGRDVTVAERSLYLILGSISENLDSMESSIVCRKPDRGQRTSTLRLKSGRCALHVAGYVRPETSDIRSFSRQSAAKAQFDHIFSRFQLCRRSFQDLPPPLQDVSATRDVQSESGILFRYQDRDQTCTSCCCQ